MWMIILMMPVSAGDFTLIIGTPAGRSPMRTFRHRPRRLWPRPTGAPEERAQSRRYLKCVTWVVFPLISLGPRIYG